MQIKIPIDSFSSKIISKGYGELVSTVSDKVEPKFCEHWEIGLLDNLRFLSWSTAKMLLLCSSTYILPGVVKEEK